MIDIQVKNVYDFSYHQSQWQICTHGSWFTMSETFMTFEINLMIPTGVFIKTHLYGIVTVTLDINHQQNQEGSFLVINTKSR